MAKQNSSLGDWAKLGYVEKDGKLVKAGTPVDPKPIKVDTLNVMLGGNNILLPKSENRKVKNATKSVVNGVKFDSQLERTMYDLLKGAGIEFEFQKTYLLQEKFRYGTEAIRAITLTVDFWLPLHNTLIDTKGWANDVAPLKMKLLKWHLFELNYANESNPEKLPKIEMPKNKEACNTLLNRILYDK